MLYIPFSIISVFCGFLRELHSFGKENKCVFNDKTFNLVLSVKGRDIRNKYMFFFVLFLGVFMFVCFSCSVILDN